MSGAFDSQAATLSLNDIPAGSYRVVLLVPGAGPEVLPLVYLGG